MQLTQPSGQPAQVSVAVAFPSTLQPSPSTLCAQAPEFCPTILDPDPSNAAHHVLTVQPSTTASILPTALVRVGYEGRFKVVRALLDTGSSISLITSKVAQQLSCKQHKNPVQISGFGGEKTSQASVNISLSADPWIAMQDSEEIDTCCHVITQHSTRSSLS